MPLTTISENRIGPATQFESDVDDTDVLVTRDAIVAGTDDIFHFGILLLGSHHDVEVQGRVSGGVGIQVGNSFTDIGNVVQVASGGIVSGINAGVSLFGASRLVNAGEIWGDTQGAVVSFSGARTATIDNSGRIAGLEHGLVAVGDASGLGVIEVLNRGVIQGGAGYGYIGMGLVNLVVNQGTMIGAVEFASAADTLDNRGGTIRGDVYLRAGADLLDNRGGIVIGTILGDAGNDTFRPGLSAETIDGGADFDTLDFSSAARGLTVSLADPSRNTREARGDSFAGIERILGSRDADRLAGDDAANTLLGRGGDDRLAGGAGDDTLGGGAGRDVLRGGSGDDAFLFRAPGQGGDRILDWGSLAGDDDRLVIHAQGFGGGLVSGGTLDPDQFRARAASNAALDADDRFVFRTSDATLWFDRDGKGGAGPVLVADLQDGAVLGAEDIWLL